MTRSSDVAPKSVAPKSVAPKTRIRGPLGVAPKLVAPKLLLGSGAVALVLWSLVVLPLPVRIRLFLGDSMLPTYSSSEIGVLGSTSWAGFGVGDVVRVENSRRQEVARGLTRYASHEVERIKGLTSSQVENTLGRRAPEVIHRDDLVLV